MTDDGLDFLPRDVAELVAREKRLSDAPDDEQARVFARVIATAGAPISEVGDVGGTRGATPAPAPIPVAPAGAAKAGVALGLLSKPALVLVTAFVAGAGAGIGVYHAVQRSGEPSALPITPTIEPTVGIPGRPEPTAPVPAPEPAPELQQLRDVPPGRPDRPSGPFRPSRDDQLAAERELIEGARAALARKNAGAALGALDVHLTRFPRGRLIEERESLRIQALVAAREHDRARKLAADFRRRYPKSIFLPIVEEALRQIP